MRHSSVLSMNDWSNTLTSEDENTSSSLWKQMKVSAEVERAIYSQLAQQIVVVGQPDGQESAAFCRINGNHGVIQFVGARTSHHSACEYRFYETSRHFTRII